MKPRKYRLPPPTSPAYGTGQVLTFTPSPDDPPPSEWIEATPVGPAPLVFDFAPEDDRANPAARRAKFLTLLAGDGPARQPGALRLDQWADVIADPAVWPELNSLPVRTGFRRAQTLLWQCLQVGGTDLVRRWLAAHEHRELQCVASNQISLAYGQI